MDRSREGRHASRKAGKQKVHTSVEPAIDFGVGKTSAGLVSKSLRTKWLAYFYEELAGSGGDLERRGMEKSEYVRKISVVPTPHDETRRGIANKGTQSQIISSCEWI